MNKIFSQFTLILALTLPGFLVIESIFPETAEAGVLFRNRRMVIRTFVPRFQSQNYQVARSTVALRKTSISSTPRPIGTVDDHFKLISSYNKYEQKLFKWEEKQAKIAKKNADKKKKLDEKASKLRQRKAERLKRAQDREQKKIQSAKDQQGSQTAANSSISGSSVKGGAASRGALGSGSQPASNAGAEKKKGFWASFVQSLFGKKAQ